MSDYILSCCSTADLTKTQLESRNINYIYFHYELNGEHHYDDLGQTMSFKDFYKTLSEGAETKTSQINAEEFQAFFEPFLEEGKDILHICLSSGISGVVNSANIAKSILEEKYPDRKIYIVDSLAASSGYGLLVDMAADLRDEGKSIEEVYEWLEENKLTVNHWFFSTDLTFYIKGGRVTKTAGLIGNLLNICPLLNVNNEGKLIPRAKIRTKKKAITAALEKMKELVKDGKDYKGRCYISHSDCFEDAKQVALLIESEFPNLDGQVRINYIGTTIGSHTGPGTVALFFVGNKRVD